MPLSYNVPAMHELKTDLFGTVWRGTADGGDYVQRDTGGARWWTAWLARRLCRREARALARLLDPRIYKVNLIPYNPTGAFQGSSPAAISAFERVLVQAGIPATVRLTRGRDIAAACGQLAAAPRQTAGTRTDAPPERADEPVRAR